MSGQKFTYTTVSTDELERLRQQASNATNLANANAALRALAKETDRLIRDQRARINSLTSSVSALNTAMSAQATAASKAQQELHSQLQATIRSTNDALRTMAEQHQADLRSLNDSFRDALSSHRAETAQLIRQNSEEMHAALNSAVSSLETAIGSVSDRVAQAENLAQENAGKLGILFSSNDALLDQAREYAGTARTLLSTISQNFRTELLLPGRLGALQAAIGEADKELEDCVQAPTNARVARLAARQACAAAMQLWEDTVRAEQAWQNALADAQCALAAACAQCQASSTIKVPAQDGSEAQAVELDVDYWSGGDLSAIKARIDGLQSVLASDADTKTLADLQNILAAAQQAASDISEASTFALLSATASQDRVDTCQDIANTVFLDQGLQIMDSGYQAGDKRGAFRVVLKNPVTGLLMVVTQTPERDESGGLRNHIQTDILDYGTNNEQDVRAIAQDAVTALQELGLNVAPVQTTPGYETAASDNTQCLDMAAWRQERAAVLTPLHQKD